jgi:hypothetical protein
MPMRPGDRFCDWDRLLRLRRRVTVSMGERIEQSDLGAADCARPVVVRDVGLALCDANSGDSQERYRCTTLAAQRTFHDQLPAQVRWKADNYNNLMEQPTLFYAVTLTLAMLGAGGGLNTGLAWLYVLLRIAHSLVQAVINVVMLRFALFMAASLVLPVMSMRAALIVFRLAGT